MISWTCPTCGDRVTGPTKPDVALRGCHDHGGPKQRATKPDVGKRIARKRSAKRHKKRACKGRR